MPEKPIFWPHPTPGARELSGKLESIARRLFIGELTEAQGLTELGQLLYERARALSQTQP